MTKKTLILGCARTGQAVARFLTKHNITYIGVDRERTHPICTHTDKEKIPWHAIKQVIVSPGIPHTHPLYRKAQHLSIECIGETEYAMRHNHKKTIAITGTNGKSTLVSQIHHVLCKKGIKAQPCGNQEIALIDAIQGDSDALIVELSSFQLETMTTQGFEAGYLLNIGPDHLDRYRTMQEYVDAKMRLAKLCPLWTTPEVINTWNIHNAQTLENTTQMIIHAAQLWGISKEETLHALKSFKGLPHRLEYITSYNGISFYNDSKSTNSNSVIFAVQTLQQPVILIAGGRTKETAHTIWSEIEAKAKRVILYGGDRKILGQHMQRPTYCVTLEEALKHALMYADKDDAICLSPGCASFDLFANYQERGRVFCQLVHKLKEKEK